MQLSVLLPGVSRPEQAVAFANLVQWTSAARLWQGQGLSLESHHLVSWLAGIGIRVPVGLGVSLMPLRSPFHAALEARSVAFLTGHEVVAGFGPGTPTLQKAVLGDAWRSQLAAAREYVETVQRLLAGRPASRPGRYFAADLQFSPGPTPPVSVGLGVLRPRMAALAAEIADHAITWLGSAAYLRETLRPAMAGVARQRVERLRLTAIVPVAVARPGRQPADLVSAACGAHLRYPHYQEVLARSHVTLTGDEAVDTARLVDAGVFGYGAVTDIHGRLAEYREAGVDEIVLNVSGVAERHGLRSAAQDLLDIIKAAS